MKCINAEDKIQQDHEVLYKMFKSLRRHEDDKFINGSIKLKKKSLNEEINRFKDINDKYIFSNVKKKIKLEINGCIKIKRKGAHEEYYNQLVKKVLHGSIFIQNKNINNILDYIKYIKYIKLGGKISMVKKKKRTDKNEIISPLLSKENINKLRYLKTIYDVKKERNQKSPRKSSYNIERKEILDLSMNRYSHFQSEISNNYNLKNNNFYDSIKLVDNKMGKTKGNKEKGNKGKEEDKDKDKHKDKDKDKSKEKEKDINIYKTNGSIKNTLNNNKCSFVLSPSCNDKIRHVDELEKKMNTFKLNIPSSIINKFNKSNNTNAVENRGSIKYNLIKERQEFMYEPIRNNKEKHNKIHLKGTINYINNNNNNKKKNNNNNVHPTKFIFMGKKKKKIIEHEGTDDNYILGNEEKKKLLYMDQYNNETNKSHETNVLCGNKIYNKCGNKNIFLDHSVFLNYNKKVPKHISMSCSSKNKDMKKSTYDETMLSMSDVDDIDYFMYIKEKNAIKYKDYMNKPKTICQDKSSIEKEKSVLRIKKVEDQGDIKEKKSYMNDLKYKIDKKEPSNKENTSNIRNKKFSSVSRKLSKHFSLSRSGATFSMSNKKEKKSNKKKRTRFNKENRYMKKYLNKIMNMSILRRHFNNVNSSVYITHQKCFDKHEEHTKINEKKCKKGVIKTVDGKEDMNILNVNNNKEKITTKGNKNDHVGDSKDGNKNDHVGDSKEDNKNDHVGDSKEDNKNDHVGDSKDNNKNDHVGDSKEDNTIILSKEKNIKIGIYFEETCDIKQSNDKNISTTNEIKKMSSPVTNKLLTKKMGFPVTNKLLTKKEGMLKKFAISKEKMDITKKEGVVLSMKKSFSLKKDAEIHISNDDNVMDKNKVNSTIKSVQDILSKQLFKSKGNPLLINKKHVPKMDSTNKMIVDKKISFKSSLFKKDENKKTNYINSEKEEEKNVNMEKFLLNELKENYLNDERINKPGLSKEDDVDIKEPVLINEQVDLIKKEDQNICTNTEQEHEMMQEQKINEDEVNSKGDENTKKTENTINDKETIDIINKKNSSESVKEEIMEKEMLDEKDKNVPHYLECNNLHNMDENTKEIKVEKCNDYMTDNITSKNNNMIIKKINMKMLPMVTKKALPKSKALPILLKKNISIPKEKFTTNKKLSNESIDKTESSNIKMDEHKEEEKQIIKPSKSIHKIIKPGRHSFFNANKLLNSIEIKIGEHNSKIIEKEGPIKMFSSSTSIISDGKIDSIHKSDEEEKINDLKEDSNVNIYVKEKGKGKGKVFMKKGIPKLMMKFNAFSTKKMGINNLENNKKVNTLRSIKDDKILEKTNDTLEEINGTLEKTNGTLEETSEISNIQHEEEVKNEKDATLQDDDDAGHTLKTTKAILMKKIPAKYKMNTVKMGDIKLPSHMNKFINKFHSVKILSTLKEFPVKKLIKKKDSNEENNSLEKIKMDKEKINDVDMEKEADEDVMKIEESVMNKKENDETEIEMNNNNEVDNNKVDNNEVDNNKVDNNEVDNNKVDNNKVDNNEIDNDKVDNNEIDNDKVDNNEIDNNKVDNNEIDNNKVDNNEIDNDKVDNNEIDNDKVDNNEIDNDKVDNNEIDNNKVDNNEIDNNKVDNNEIDNDKVDNISQDKSEISLNKIEEPNLVAESTTIEKEPIDKIIPRSFSKSLSIPMKVPTIKENINKAKPTFWNKPKGKMFFLTKKEKSISQAKEILRSLEKSNN
ncbi:hypothetical protein PFMG_03833 [Plasmodium falciparum IGH-CR14]|uniref:Uncharacterized protein n=2 Tax=Plasmodium falciparum TaxID=5833 RepID=A0A0L1IDF1_PLAFA|nr:hypothetical protein PFMG_03833 [Plasmodium falciparum IGH-CR14]